MTPGITLSLPSLPLVSQAQPLPNWVAPAALNCFLNSSREPKSRSMASFSSPSGSSAHVHSPLPETSALYLSTALRSAQTYSCSRRLPLAQGRLLLCS